MTLNGRTPLKKQGSPLPRALFVNDVGYLPDGTPMNRAGNAINHPAPLALDCARLFLGREVEPKKQVGNYSRTRGLRKIRTMSNNFPG